MTTPTLTPTANATTWTAQERHIVDERNRAIAEAFDSPTVSAEQAHSRALLMAAAPDLLARLRDANVIIEKALAVMTNEQKCAWGELVDRVDLDGTGVTRRDVRDAAIARATAP